LTNGGLSVVDLTCGVSLCCRDMEAVLRADREALRAMQKHQPRFSEEQKRELSQVHPWIRTGRLPRAINVSVSVSLSRSRSLSL